tara:strand:+ start:1267 stop:2070 length:804 start_codon:yes stop_codon:yes gene_type:complete
MDGMIEHIGPMLALVAATSLAGMMGLAHVWRVLEHGTRPARLILMSLSAILLAGFAALSIWHNQSGEPLGIFFGSEAQDFGLSEYGVVLCLIGCTALLARLAWAGTTLERLVFGFAAIACLVIAGEELSWGQWIFGWATPEPLAAVNLQQETNAHNLVNPRIYDVIYSAIGFVVLAGAALSYWAFRAPVADQTPLVLRLLRAAGVWLRDSRFGLVLTLSAAVLLQHELFEEYSEFVFAMAALLYLNHLFNSGSHGVLGQEEDTHVTA